MLCVCIARIRLETHVNNKSNFVQIFLLNPNFLLAHRNRYSAEMDDGQRTPRGHHDLNSYVKILHVLVFITDRWADGRTDREIHPLRMGWRNFSPLS